VELRGEISPTKPLVVVAVDAEAAHLSTALPVLIVGVGKIDAVASLYEAVGALPLDERPTTILNLGTAGALHDHHEGVFEIGTVLQHDLDGPAIETITGVNPSPDLHLGDGLVLASGDTFIQHADDRARLAARADLCDMEGYAVASTALRLGLGVSVIKHVSDRADARAAASWNASVRHSSRVLGAWLKEHVDA
jgi:adenosylhomocysteine nucleosidase